MADVVDGLPQCLEVALVADAALVTEVRASVREALSIWGAGELSDTATLLVSEFVSNAIQHTRAAQISVRVTWTWPVLRVEVQDGDPSPPATRQADADLNGTCGRGLFLVGSLAERWGMIAIPDGKTMWFELVAQPTLSVARS
ncbi:ATP-binding protein [Streptomyces nigrescens]|uniref:ATP-binding protein n=1 Tax=Streptomyces nigrescens TaxID=1920 RepID=A0ABY7IYD8_STRNI|nr:ATP-binding protein [Streptomyces nigrescens]WAU04003.1 ATP-binding protein [Streptomyces nigrescens]